MRKATLLKLINLYPPLLGAGVRVRRISPDLTEIDVEMKLRFWNRNYVGTHFGGSLYTMTDPFYMIMLIENLGPAYVVWDKAAAIRFRSPGRGRVKAEFRLTAERVAAIKAEVDVSGRAEPHLTVEVTDDEGRIVAEVEKVLSVRKKLRD